MCMCVYIVVYFILFQLLIHWVKFKAQVYKPGWHFLALFYILILRHDFQFQIRLSQSFHWMYFFFLDEDEDNDDNHGNKHYSKQDK